MADFSKFLDINDFLQGWWDGLTSPIGIIALSLVILWIYFRIQGKISLGTLGDGNNNTNKNKYQKIDLK